MRRNLPQRHPGYSRPGENEVGLEETVLVTTYTLRKGAAEKTRADVVVVGVVRTAKGLRAAPGGEGVAAAYGRKLVPLLSALGFEGRQDELAKVPTGGVLRSPLLILVGLGEERDVDASVVRRAAGVAIRGVSNAATVAVALPAQDGAQVRAVLDGLMLGGYAFSTYKSAPAPAGPGEVVVLTDTARSRDSQRAVEAARVVTDATRLARDWVNTPAGDLTPAAFAEAVTAEHRSRKPARVKVSVVEDAELRERGFGGIIGVGRGSANPPRLVKVAYTPRGAGTHLALVGKGITFDSGGLSIKPAAGMTTMKCDMAGAAAVVAATFAIAELGLPVAVTTYAPMAENMPSGSAMRPGDVLTMHSGKTVEVTNTDAEGRLILADALALAVEAEPDAVLDVATLTGPCIVALGEKVAGVFGEDDTVGAVLAASETSGELLWRLPIPDETRAAVREESKIADVLQHNWVRWGSALYAAAFLEQFVDGRPWAHLDIAGPAWNTSGPWGHVPAGGTGYGVTTLVAYAESLAAQSSPED
jgi:leucyl aminopeptidase